MKTLSRTKVVIASVPFVDEDTPLATPAYLKALLVKNNVDCVGLDLNIEIVNLIRNDPHKKDFLNFFYKQIIKPEIVTDITQMLYHYVHRIMSYNPTHIALSLFTNDSQVFTKWLAALIKHLYPDVIVIIGGPGLETLGAHNYNFPERLKDLGYIDHYFVGDANDNFINYFTNGTTEGFDTVLVKQTSDAKHWITPDYDDYNFLYYRKSLSLPVVDSRGCVQNCEFCDVVAFWDKFQNLTADDVFEQMLELAARYNIYRFQFASSICNGNLVQFRKLVKLIADHNDSVDFADQEFFWHGSFIIRKKDRHSDELWRNIKRSNGFLYCGVESIISEVRIKLGKNFNNEDLASHLELGKKYNVPMNLLVIAAYQSESADDHASALQWFENNKHYANNPVQQVQMTQLGILEGTRLQKSIDIEKFNRELSMRTAHAFKLKQKAEECGFTVRAFY